MEVGQTGFVVVLVGAPYLGPDLQVGDRRQVAFAKQQRKSVGENLVVYACLLVLVGIVECTIGLDERLRAGRHGAET